MRGHSIIVVCEQCGTPFQTYTSRIAAGRSKVCSRACVADRQSNTPESFWSHVDRSNGSGCWPWMLERGDDGYGHAWYHGERWMAHRLAWVLTFGPIADGLIVRHKVCDNPPCCNPAHLLVGTTYDNQHDAIEKGRNATGDRHWSKRHPELVPRGERQPRAIITDDIVRLLRARYVRKHGIVMQLSKEFDIPYGVVQSVVTGRTWKHVV